MHPLPVFITLLVRLSVPICSSANRITSAFSSLYFYYCFLEKRIAPPSNRNKEPNSASNGSELAVVGRTSGSGEVSSHPEGGGGGGGGAAAATSTTGSAQYSSFT